MSPQSVLAAAGNGQATVSFAAPIANGGAPITGYTVVSNPSGITVNTTTSPATIVGLTNGIAYTFAVAAVNGFGFGPSAVSNSVTPGAGQTLSLGPVAFPVGVQGAEYPIQILSATGGTAPYTFTVGTGALPAGLALAGLAFGGTPASTPAPAGNAAFTIQVTDAVGNAVSAPASISIEPAGADLILSDGIVILTMTPGAVPAPASVTVRSSDIQQTLGYSVMQDPSASWLSVSGGGTAPGSFTIGLSPAAIGMGTGTYSSTVTVVCAAASPCAGTAKTVQVVLNVGAAGTTQPTPATPAMAPLGIQFRTPAGNPLGNPAGSFPVTDGPWQASVLPGAGWLSLTTAAGSAPGTVSFAVDPSTLAGNPAQVYQGVIQVVASDGSQTDDTVVLDMLAPGTSVKPELSTAGMVFVSGAGSQQMSIYAGSNFPLAYQAASSSSWLTVSPGAGMAMAGAPGQTVVSVNPAGLAPGVYVGGVSYAFASDAIRTVNVTMLVPDPVNPCDPTQLFATQVSLANNFQTAVGLPVEVAVNVVNGCGTPVTSAAISASFSNGDAPVVLSAVDNASGTFLGTWTPQAVGVQVAVTATAVGQNGGASAVITGKVTPY
jgi:hypothetical protein